MFGANPSKMQPTKNCAMMRKEAVGTDVLGAHADCNEQLLWPSRVVER